jgi:hypothetical protein
MRVAVSSLPDLCHASRRSRLFPPSPPFRTGTALKITSEYDGKTKPKPFVIGRSE